MEIGGVLAVNAGVSALCFLVLWRVAVALKDPSFIDSWWGAGMVVIAVSTYLQSEGGPHAVLLTLLCAAWGLRLGIYLLWRWRQHGADRRYTRMMADAKEQKGWDFATASLIYVFSLQALLQFIVCLPVQLGQSSGLASLGPLAWAGAALATPSWCASRPIRTMPARCSTRVCGATRATPTISATPAPGGAST